MACYSGPKIVKSGLVLHLDAANLKSYARNVHPNPLDLYKWYVGLRGNNTGNQVLVYQDTGTAKSPAGGIPMRMDIVGTDPHIGSYADPRWNLAEAAVGERWIVSVYAKATATMRPQLFIFGDDDGAGYLEAPAGASADITTEWSRIYFATTFANSLTKYIQLRLDGPDTGQIGQSIWFDGLQLERVSTSTNTPTAFTPGNGALLGNRIGNLVSPLSRFGLSNGLLYDAAAVALSFDGVDDLVDASAGTLGDVVTVEMVAKLKSLGGVMPFGFSSYDVYCSGGQMGFNTYSSDRYGLTAAQTTSLGLLNNWRHYAFVMVNNTSLDINPYTSNKFFVNGVDQPLSQTAGVQSTATRSFSDGLVRLSGSYGQAAYKNPMDLSLFRVYNRALSGTEIKQNFDTLRRRYGI